MKCQQCNFDNPEGMKFCGECGAKLDLVCPGCKFSNPSSFKFCGNCGHNLTPSSEPPPRESFFDDKIAKIKKYLPEGLADKILAQRDKIEGERKQVTVMFCDMAGFTALIDSIGPEIGYSIMDQIYEILIHNVHEYQGTVNEMTGDGIMALFGAPIALEDAPQRAIRASLAIHRAMVKFSDKVEQTEISNIKMRIGINTGPVVVGTLGNDLRVEFKAVGDTVNLASRIESIAEPGSTYVAEDTFKLTEGFFRFEAIGKRIVKGKKEPILLYRVIAASSSRTRFDVSAERGLAPLVGRERELEILMDGFKMAKEGRGQAFSIVSEAGVGKSRLLYEFRKKLSSEDVMFLEGRCLSFSGGVAYHPIIDILKANLDIAEGDKDSTIKEKAIKGLKILDIDETIILPYLLKLLSVKDSGFDKIKMSPDATKERIMEMIKLFTLKGSKLRPVITAYEDLHWADKSSEEVLRLILESIPGARVLMIFTYRPEFVHTWGGKSYHNQTNLNRLSNRESLELVKNLLGTEKIDIELEELFLEKTEGVPYFIEEFVKSLNDLKMVERKNNTCCLAKNMEDVTIPSTIQGVIMARVDALPEAAKGILQTGSVIEREFTYELIKHVTNISEKELLSCLSVLKDSELLYERGIFPESTYIFKHALTRDVVYESILTNKRKSLHEKIGNAIEELYANRIEQKYELLAHHYGNAKCLDKAVSYARLAAEKAHKLSQFQQAIQFYDRATEWLLKLPENKARIENLIDVQLENCWSNIGLGQFGKVEEIALKAETAAKTLGDRTRLGIAYLGIGTAYVYRGNFEKTEHYAKQAIKYLEGTKEERSLAIANLVLGACYIGQGLWCKSEPCFSNTIEIYEELGLKSEYVMGWNALPYTIVCGQLGYNLATMGKVQEGKELFERGYTSDLEQVSNLTTKMAYCSWQGLFISLVGEDYFGAASKIDELVDMAERSDSPFMMLAFNTAKANVLLGKQDYEKVLKTGINALQAIEGKQIRTGHVANVYYDMVLASLKIGDQGLAKRYYEKGKSLVELAPNWWGPRFDFAEGMLLGNEVSPDYQRIKECFNISIQGDENVGAVVPAAQTRYHIAKVLAREGATEDSLKIFTELSNQFQSWDIPIWQKQCGQELEPYRF